MNNKIKKFLSLKNKRKIISLTAYSNNISSILDKFCDLVLVGDSLANVLYGMKNTHKLNLNTMINHAQSVRKGIKKSLFIVDMPKNSYKIANQAIKNAKIIIKKTGCDGVKIENNSSNLKIVKSMCNSNINVMGHIGYTPQFKKKFKVEGKKLLEQAKLLKQAKQIEDAGAFSIVLECISKEAAQKITKSLKIPTIGIGSSIYCDGQILVTDDIIGLSGFYPKFVKRYVNMKNIIKKAVKSFSKDVKTRKFPNNRTSF